MPIGSGSARRTKHLAPAILRFLEDKENPPCGPEKAEVVREWVAAAYDASFRKWSSPPPEGYVSGRHPISAHASTKCVLQSWFKHNQFPREPLSPRAKANFRIGEIVEVELYAMAMLAGEEVDNWQHKLTLERHGWPTKNFIDFTHKSKVDGKTRIVDAKTMSSYGYDKSLKSGIDDSFGYLGQMSNYIDGALEAGIVNSREGIFLIYKKETGHIDEVTVNLDPALVEKAHANSELVQLRTEYEEHACDSEDPDRCDVCQGLPMVKVGAADHLRPERPEQYSAIESKNGYGWKLCTACAYCDYKFSCWTEPYQRVKVETSDHGTPVPKYDELPSQTIQVDVQRGRPSFYVRRR